MIYFFVTLTILLTVFGQMVLKWQVLKAGSFPSEPAGQFSFLLNLLLNPWVLSSLLAAFFAAVSWMVAMTKLSLGQAYPYTGLTFVLVIYLSHVYFNDLLTWPRIAGTALIVAGITLGSRG
jgi:multidrug transporter EmrE-like cation transporter